MSQMGRPVNTPSNRREVFSERSRSMHSFARHFHSEASEASAKETKGLILNGGWRYDLGIWFIDTFVFRGQLRELRQRTANLARMQPGEQVLDVGCGTGTLAMEVQSRVGRAGRVAGVDPGTQQIARARRSAARRHVPIDFQIGMIEQLPFPDQSFDVVKEHTSELQSPVHLVCRLLLEKKKKEHKHIDKLHKKHVKKNETNIIYKKK